MMIADSSLHPTPREHVIPVQHEEQGMKDMEQHFLKLRADAEECSNVSKRATDPQKRDLFARLAEHLNVLASEVARARVGSLRDAAPLASGLYEIADQFQSACGKSRREHTPVPRSARYSSATRSSALSCATTLRIIRLLFRRMATVLQKVPS
jgi:hypothetical protein